MDNCLEYLEMISAYIDGELSGQDRQKLGEHLRICPNCTSTLKAYSVMSNVAKESLVDVPETLCSGVMERIANVDTANAAGNLKKYKTVTIILSRVLPVAACLVLLLLTVPRLFGLSGNQSGETTTESGLTGMDMAAPPSASAAGGATQAPAPEAPGGSIYSSAAPEEDSGIIQENDSADGGSDSSVSVQGDREDLSYAPSAAPPMTSAPTAEYIDDNELYMTNDIPEEEVEPGDPRDDLPGAPPEDSGYILSTENDPNYGGLYAIVFIVGELPESLIAYAPSTAASNEGLEVYFNIPLDATFALIEETIWNDDIIIDFIDEEGTYTMVYYIP